jgi:hypothetical protein
MQVSSETDTGVGVSPSLLASGHERAAKFRQFSDEEFPDGLRAEYDWMLQPASQFRSRKAMRLAAVILTILFVVASIVLVRKISSPHALLNFPSSILR